MDDSLFFIPFIVAFSFWVAGMRGNWRRTFFIVLISFAGMILAYQKFYSVAVIITRLFNNNKFTYGMIVAGFGVTLIVTLIGLYILYVVLWKPGNISAQDLQKGEVRFLQSIITAICGWVVGVLFLACIIKYAYPNVVIPPAAGAPFLWETLKITVNVTNQISVPFSGFDLPRFLVEIAAL